MDGEPGTVSEEKREEEQEEVEVEDGSPGAVPEEEEEGILGGGAEVGAPHSTQDVGVPGGLYSTGVRIIDPVGIGEV